MRQVFAGVAVAALLCAVPALAQTTAYPAQGTSKSTTQGSSAGTDQTQSGTSTHQATAQDKAPRHGASHRTSASKSKGHESDDAMTEQLNRQEIDRLQKAGG
jgi:hypothetical protein